MTDRGFHGRRLAPPLFLAAVVVAAAPFLGTVRDQVLDRLPASFLDFALFAFGILLAGLLLAGVARIRRYRALRYAGIALCALLVWLQMVGFATDIPEVDVVERIHILEYGLLSLLFYRGLRPLGGVSSFLLAILSATLVGLCDEWLQWLVASRVGDVRDIGLNASAAGTGALFAACLLSPGGKRRRPDPAGPAAIFGLAAVTTLVFGGFYHCGHLGYEILDRDEGVTFVSWHTEQELREVADERARRWRSGRLPTLDPTSREDYFFLEGTSHVAHRNASLQRGDFVSSWMEQRILERYFAPVLEQRGLRSGEALDLSDRQRDDLRRRAALRGLPATYRSPVLRDRIAVAPSKPVWWTAIVSVAAILGALAVRSWLLRCRNGFGAPGDSMPQRDETSQAHPMTG